MTRWRWRSNRVTDDSQLENSLSSFSILEPAPKEIAPPDDHKKLKQSIILDPRGTVARRWNIIFFTVSMTSLFVDPNFFLLPQARQEMCIELGQTLKIVLTMIRSVVDLFYVIHIFLRFRTAYVAPSSRVIGRGDLVINPWKIALRYLRFGFWIDLAAAFPLPQVLIWGILPNLKGSMASSFKTCLILIILVQMLLRFCLAYPLSLWLAKASGIITEKAWVGAAYNLMFYLLASILSGCCWYILSVERQEECWRSVCKEESSSCMYAYFDCSSIEQPSRVSWIQSSNLTNYCDPNNNFYQYGIYIYTITDNISSGGFFNKYFYCFWWGIRNLSSQGQNLAPSIDLTENIFSYLVGFLGLILFAFFIGNMQKYLQSANQRLEEWRIKRTDLEQWMHHRQLPKELRQSVLRFHKYKGVATQGVDEEAILKALPRNLQRQTKQYLCLNLVRQVPLFDKLDDRTLDAICERLRPAIYTRGMHLVHEEDQVNEMLFIIRGHLYSYTTYGGRTGFFNSLILGPNDMCGEELLTWALDTRHLDVLPLSTRTVKAISDVEGFTLGAEDLKFISVQFRRMHSRELKHRLRFYSQHWRTWAACFIQAAWRRHKSHEGSAAEAQQFPSGTAYENMDAFVPRPDAGIEAYAARLIADIRRSASNRFLATI